MRAYKLKHEEGGRYIIGSPRDPFEKAVFMPEREPRAALIPCKIYQADDNSFCVIPSVEKVPINGSFLKFCFVRK